MSEQPELQGITWSEFLTVEEEYVGTFGTHCPRCKGTSLTKEAPVQEEDKVRIKVRCNLCTGEWSEAWWLTGITFSPDVWALIGDDRDERRSTE